MQEIYKGRMIKVYLAASFPGGGPSKWIFDIYRKSDGKCVYDKGISDSEAAAITDGRKWVDKHR